MGNYLSLPILGLAVILQATIVPQIASSGGRPDLVFLLVVTWALNVRLEEAVVWAFAGGIMQDLLSSAPTGTSVPGLVVIVFVIDAIHRQVYRIGLVTVIWIVLLGTLFQQVLILIILIASGLQPALIDQVGYTALADSFTYIILPTVIYNAIIVFPVYGVVRLIQRRLEGRRQTVS